MKVHGRCHCGHPEGSEGCRLFHLQPENRPVSLFRSELIEPYVEQHVYRNLRRREKAAELLDDYEREHGVITDEELASLDQEWLT